MRDQQLDNLGFDHLLAIIVLEPADDSHIGEVLAILAKRHDLTNLIAFHVILYA